MIKLLTDGSRQSYQLIDQLDKTGISYEIEVTECKNAPILIVDNKEMNFAKALRWIRKRGDRSGDFI